MYSIAQNYSTIVAFDTETTGLYPFARKNDGTWNADREGPDRLCSIAAVVLHRDAACGWMTGERRLWIVDPQRGVAPQASAVNGFVRHAPASSHSLNPWRAAQMFYASLAVRVKPFGKTGPVREPTDLQARPINLFGKPLFSAIVDELLQTIGHYPLIAHNAAFDYAMVDAELARLGRPPLANPFICTKRAYNEMRGFGRTDTHVRGSNLNALCDELGVNRASRFDTCGQEVHGALIDAELVARCFFHLSGRPEVCIESPATFMFRQDGSMRCPSPLHFPAKV